MTNLNNWIKEFVKKLGKELRAIRITYLGSEKYKVEFILTKLVLEQNASLSVQELMQGLGFTKMEIISFNNKTRTSVMFHCTINDFNLGTLKTPRTFEKNINQAGSTITFSSKLNK